MLFCVCVYSMQGLLLSGAVNESTPAIHETTSSFQCGQSDSIQDDQHLMETLNKISQLLPAPQQSSSPTCSDFLRNNSNATSGYYEIQAANGEVFCAMEGIHCGGEGGWIRVAYLSMNDPSSQCPIGFAAIKTNEKKFSVRNSTYGECAAITL